MINKIFKRIFDRYSNIFKFLFYIKYLFLIFFIASLTFLLIPKFFDYEKKQIYIKNYLIKNYNLTIKETEKVQLNIFPLPNLEINKVTLDLNKVSQIKANKILIYPNIFRIYDFENFEANKVSLINGKLNLKAKDFSSFYIKLINQKNKISFNNLSIEIINEKQPIISLTKTNYSNFGYKKHEINGFIFKKKFNIKLKEKFKRITFNMPDSGIFAEMNFLGNSDTSTKEGKFKAKILNSNIKFDFSYDGNYLSIKESIFRNKYLSFRSNGKIAFNPFFSVNIKSLIKDIKKDAFYKTDIRNLLQNKNFLKRLNINHEINYISKKFSRNIINKVNSKFSITFGTLYIKKNVSLDEGLIDCNNEVNLIDEKPILIFDCLIKSNNSKKFLKNFSVNKKKLKEDYLNLEIKGNLDIIKKKINFLNIEMNNSYKASGNDLNFFKNSFEKFFLTKSLLDTFNKENIDKFIVEIL